MYHTVLVITAFIWGLLAVGGITELAMVLVENGPRRLAITPTSWEEEATVLCLGVRHFSFSLGPFTPLSPYRSQ